MPVLAEENSNEHEYKPSWTVLGNFSWIGLSMDRWAAGRNSKILMHTGCGKLKMMTIEKQVVNNS